jgi:protein-disulfide isomerase
MMPLKRTVHGLLVILVAAHVAAFAHLGRAQPVADVDALRKELETLKHDVREMRKLLDELRQQPKHAPPAQPNAEFVTLSVGGGRALGNADAPVTIIEFSDYQCPFCRRHAMATLPELKKEYVDSGKVRYVYRDLPLDSVHPQARKAAEAAHCAGDQGKFWEMHDVLFAKQRQLMLDHLKEHATALGLDRAAFDACLDHGKYAKTVSEDEMAGRAVAAAKTPTFFIGRTRTDGTIESVRILGAQPLATFRRVIDQLLEDRTGS